jgi:uncharacterized phiE125 gp8 family phage protein
VHVAVITPPIGFPLSLDLAKAQCRVQHNDDDALIQSLIEAATGWLDGPGGWLGRCLMPQILELRLDSFYPDDWNFRGLPIWQEGVWNDWTRWPFQNRIQLPYPPFLSVTSVIYEDLSGADQVLTSSGWVVDREGEIGSPWQTPWPAGRVEADAVRIQYQAGYALSAGSSTVPAPIRHALMLLVSHWYAHPDAVVGVENRDSSTEMPLAVESLLAPLRVWNV